VASDRTRDATGAFAGAAKLAGLSLIAEGSQNVLSDAGVANCRRQAQENRDHNVPPEGSAAEEAQSNRPSVGGADGGVNAHGHGDQREFQMSSPGTTRFHN
jgi:hypothetical protein